MHKLFFTLVLPLLALIAGGYAARHAFSEGIHTVLASQPTPANNDISSPIVFSTACRLDSRLQYQNPTQCEMEKRASGDDGRLVFHAPPLPTMTKAQSENASAWFTLAAFAIPLSLGAALLIGFLVVYAMQTE